MFSKILKKILVCFFVILFSTNAFSQNQQNGKKLIDRLGIKVQNIEKSLSNCLDSKKNKFKNIESTVQRVATIYYNSVLDFILDKNKDFLNENQNLSKLCVEVLFAEHPNRPEGFMGTQSTLIRIFLSPYSIIPGVVPSKTDADIAARLSHEIAHGILDHYAKVLDLLNKTTSSFNDFIKLKKKHEIEADNLGLELYLRAGFGHNEDIGGSTSFGIALMKADDKIYTSLGEPSQPKNIPTEKWKRYTDINTISKCISEGNDILVPQLQEKIKIEDIVKSEKFTTFLDEIQYIPEEEAIHPSFCWRLWNSYALSLKLYSDKTISSPKGINNILYLNFDFSTFDPNILRILKSNINSDNVEIKSGQINHLIFNNYPYTIIANEPNKKDIGFTQDNHLILKYYDIVKLILANSLLSMFKQSISLNDDDLKKRMGKEINILTRELDITLKNISK